MNNRNLIAALAIAVLVTAAVTTAGCTTNTSPTATPTPYPFTQTATGNNTTFSSAAGFNITYPTTLRTDSNNTASSIVQLYVYLAKNNTVDGVLVGTEPVDPTATSVDYASFNINKVNDYPDYKLLSNNTTEIGSKTAYTIVFQATIPVQLGTTASTVQNMTLKLMQTYVVNNKTGYIITYKALPGDYNTYLAPAQQIMDSFVLK